MDSGKHWVAWHRAYDDPSSSLSRRLELVRGHLSRAISQAPPGAVRVVSLCAGQGHDVLGVLPGHPRRDEVSAILVEADPHNAGAARRTAAAAGLAQVEVRQADASRTVNYAGALPADVLLLCGIFGNVSHGDIKRTVEAAPAMCREGAAVIWTRHREPPDATPLIRAWFTANGLAEVAFGGPPGSRAGVGVNRRDRARRQPLPAGPLFTFRPPPGRM